jgi:hypothetical protein
LDVPHVRSNRKKMLQYFQTWKPWSDQFMPPQFWCMKSQKPGRNSCRILSTLRFRGYGFGLENLKVDHHVPDENGHFGPHVCLPQRI